MGWSLGWDENWKRYIGYSVPAQCDHPGCSEKIDRGLSFVCGGEAYGGQHGCGLHFCEKHLMMAGDKRENKSLCARCYYGKKAYDPKPDIIEWRLWLLIHPSWEEWRAENAEQVKLMTTTLEAEIPNGATFTYGSTYSDDANEDLVVAEALVCLWINMGESDDCAVTLDKQGDGWTTFALKDGKPVRIAAVLLWDSEYHVTLSRVQGVQK